MPTFIDECLMRREQFLCRRYVDDTLAIMLGLDAPESFLDVLNGLHPSIHFTMELSNHDSIPFIGMLITKSGNKLETHVY